MFNKIAHVAIAVQDLKEAVEFYVETLGGIQERPIHRVPEAGREMVMISLGNVKIEFMAPIGNEGPLSEFLKKNGEGLHHVAVEVNDIEKAIEDFSHKGITHIDKEMIDRPNARAAYIHPEAMNGALVEMMEMK